MELGDLNPSMLEDLGCVMMIYTGFHFRIMTYLNFTTVRRDLDPGIMGLKASERFVTVSSSAKSRLSTAYSQAVCSSDDGSSLMKDLKEILDSFNG